MGNPMNLNPLIYLSIHNPDSDSSHITSESDDLKKGCEICLLSCEFLYVYIYRRVIVSMHIVKAELQNLTGGT